MSERDEQTHAALIREQFTKQAEPFAALGIHSHGESLELLRTGLRLRGDERLLDAGCGPGLLVRHFAPLVREVVGLDATPAMLNKARALANEQALSNVRLLEGDMEHLPFADDSFDAVVTRYTFHHLLHPERAMAELVRVCRPAGRIVVCDAAPRADARAAYDAWEQARDASHTSARTEAELVALAAAHVQDPQLQRFRLRAVVRDLLESCFPSDAEALYTSMAENVTHDTLDMQPRWRGDTLLMSFPIGVISGTKPAHV